jgi:ubiquitin-conjugating enzyme E2 Q
MPIFPHLGAVVSFKVGLTQRYKPSKKHAVILVKIFGLVVLEETVFHMSVHEAMPQDLENAKDDFDDPSSDKIQLPTAVDKQIEGNDAGRFEGFSLSVSLESLLENRFIHILQLRIKFKLCSYTYSKLSSAGTQLVLYSVDVGRGPTQGNQM